MPTVLMPDGTHVAMPDDPDPALLQRLKTFQDAQAPAEPPATTLNGPNIAAGVGDAALTMGTGLAGKVGGDVAGLGDLVRALVTGDKSADPTATQAKVRDFLTHAPSTPVGKALIQGLSKPGQWWHDLAAKPLGDLAAPGEGERNVSPAQVGTASGITEAVDQLPALLGLKGSAAAPKVAALLKGAPGGGAGKFTARGMMQSALKPTEEELKTGKAGKAIDTMLDKGLNVSRGGVDKMNDTVTRLNTQIDAAIDANPNLRIDKNKVRVEAEKARDSFLKQVNATDDFATVQRVIDNFMNPPMGTGRTTMSVRGAQEMKKGTYRQLEARKAFKGDEVKAAQVAGEQALARGLREEIARAVPDVQPLNEAESQMLNALSITERRVLLEANKNPAGLAWLTLNPAKFAGFMADRSPLFKSMIARMLNQGAKSAPAMGRAAQTAGLGVTAGADTVPEGQ